MLISLCTVWKIQDFSNTQILLEISFEEYRSSRNAAFYSILGAKVYKIQMFRAYEIVKMADFKSLASPFLISHKMWMTEKIPKFQHSEDWSVTLFRTQIQQIWLTSAKASQILWFTQNIIRTIQFSQIHIGLAKQTTLANRSE